MAEETILLAYTDQLREGLSKYTKKAFRMLPELDRPCILDIGCGSGIPTLELAGLSNGQIIGLDINQSLLDRLAGKIEKAGLSDRVKALKCSMLDMDFPDESFDIIWSEGSISVIGFQKGLKEWRRLLKPDGSLVIHDEEGNITGKLEQISNCGYELIEYFTLHEDIWWNEYYAPLEKRTDQIRAGHTDAPGVLAALDSARQEIDLFRNNPGQYSSAFFIMSKRQ